MSLLKIRKRERTLKKHKVKDGRDETVTNINIVTTKTKDTDRKHLEL